MARKKIVMTMTADQAAESRIKSRSKGNWVLNGKPWDDTTAILQHDGNDVKARTAKEAKRRLHKEEFGLLPVRLTPA